MNQVHKNFTDLECLRYDIIRSLEIPKFYLYEKRGEKLKMKKYKFKVGDRVRLHPNQKFDNLGIHKGRIQEFMKYYFFVKKIDITRTGIDYTIYDAVTISLNNNTRTWWFPKHCLMKIKDKE